MADIPTAVSVANIPFSSSQHETAARLQASVPQWVSITHGRGTATIEFSNRQTAQAAVQEIGRITMRAGDTGRSFKLRASIVAGSTSSFVQTEAPKSWPFDDASAMSQSSQATQNERDLDKLLSRLPEGPIRDTIGGEIKRMQREEGATIKELYLALGRKCELVFSKGAANGRGTLIKRSQNDTSQEQLDLFKPLFEGLSAEHRRTGIEATLHRISRTVHAVDKTECAITARVGRVIQGQVLPMLMPAFEPTDPSLAVGASAPMHDAGDGTTPEVRALATLVKRGMLIVGPPNVGKTTVLRELARLLSTGDERVVVIVDKSLEIAGTGVVPHPAIHNARVLTVDHPSHQHRVMLEAVENQSPDIVIVDELSTKEECQAARTITGRGVAVVASVHGESLSQLIDDPERSLLVGGVTSVTLGAKEAEARADGLRQVSRRMANCVFGAAVELRGFSDWILHADVEATVDAYLDRTPFTASWRQRATARPTVTSTPLVGVRQQGSSLGFAYARLRPGEIISTADGGPSFRELGASGQKKWDEVSVGIFEPVRAGGAPTAPPPRPPPHAAFQFGQPR